MAEDRSEVLQSAAYAALKPSGKGALHVIEDALSRSGDGVAISLNQFLALGLCRTAARYGVKQCERVGLVTVNTGPGRVHVFMMADGWKSISADEAARRMALGVPARVREGHEVPEGYFDHAVQSYIQRGKRFRAELRRLS